jgi:hypothetical protein
MLLENAAKNYPLINWIKSFYSADKRLALIIKDYEEGLISISSLGNIPGNNNGNGSANGSAPGLVSSSTTPFISPISALKQQQPLLTETVVRPVVVLNGSSNMSEASMSDENSSDHILLYLPELYKSIEIKDNLIGSVMTLVKNRQIKILDEEAYLMRKVAIAANAAATSNLAQQQQQQQQQHASTNPKPPNNIYDHYRVYNEIILPNLNSLSKNVKDSVVLFALDHADPKMLEILRDHPCIPVSPFGRRLKKPNKLVHPLGKISPLYSDSDERFPCGSKDTYIREDRLQILKILGMKCDYLN